MNPNSVIAVLSSLQKMWEAESQKKFQEEIMKIIHSLVEQMNMINSNQMKEMSDILTRFEWTQYWMMVFIFLATVVFIISHMRLSRKIRYLESKIDKN